MLTHSVRRWTLMLTHSVRWLTLMLTHSVRQLTLMLTHSVRRRMLMLTHSVRRRMLMLTHSVRRLTLILTHSVRRLTLMLTHSVRRLTLMLTHSVSWNIHVNARVFKPQSVSCGQSLLQCHVTTKTNVDPHCQMTVSQPYPMLTLTPSLVSQLKPILILIDRCLFVYCNQTKCWYSLVDDMFSVITKLDVDSYC